MPVQAPPRDATVVADSALTQRKILRFYTPLAVSWLFMAVEGPVSIALISRLPRPEISTAAFLVMMGLAIWIESPVIDLLSTSTTLSKSRQSYAMLSRFVWWILAWVTVVHALIAATPLYGLVVEGLMGVNREVAEAVRPGLIVMTPWSALIGWRRYLQGIMIRFGHTRMIGVGTGVRVATMTVGGISLYSFTGWPSMLVVSVALLTSVAAETLFIHAASRSVIRGQFDSSRPSQGPEEPLTFRKLLAFHLPLTATTMVMLLGTPLVGAALARTPDAVLAMASWQVASAVAFLHRTVTFALPEVVITLYKDAASAQVLKRFCLNVGLLSSGTLAVFALTGLDRLFFEYVLRTKPDVAYGSHLAYLAVVFLPLIGAFQAYVRGMLTAHHLTVARLQAVVVSMLGLVVMLALGVWAQAPGYLVAAAALTLAMLAELAILTRSWRKGGGTPLSLSP